ncbi:MAG: APC family permease [Candidatus Kapaibacteriota bacterium]
MSKLFDSLKRYIIGERKTIDDRSIFHKLTLIAFFAWVGLGADGLSSSCYGPEEAFNALGKYPYLSIFIALGTAITIFVISASYSQIIELFPSGGGGYLVASKLLSPTVGMVAGSSLVIDYILTISISIVSGIDALFSFFSQDIHYLKIPLSMLALTIMIILNLRGVKESVSVLLPIFMIFVITHVAAIIYIIGSHAFEFPSVVSTTVQQWNGATSELGYMGAIMLILRAYSMGAGTYTGIEAVSNAMPILREPRVETAKTTMKYMAFSLAFVAVGLMLSYALMHVQDAPGKTLNAVLFEKLTMDWGAGLSTSILLIVLISEAVLLFVAAQAGFLGGPQILSNMALDRWFPTRFAMLSDRFVSQNGVLLVGIAAGIVVLVTGGSVHLLIVLYSINVFITFTLSQLGMVKHWIQVRHVFQNWKSKIFINGLGLVMSSFILVAVVIIKFSEGGWATILLTGGLVALVLSFRRHYNQTSQQLKKLDELVMTAIDDTLLLPDVEEKYPACDPKAKTAVFLVSGFSGLGLHTLFTVMRTFEGTFKNFVFVQVGVLDAGNFKGSEEVDNLQLYIDTEASKYVNFMRNNGYFAESYTEIGTDVVSVVADLSKQIVERYPHTVVFGGQVVFPEESIFSKWLHNYTVFAVQRRLYLESIPVVILPVRI